MEKLWGGRFIKETSELMIDFHSSIQFDQKLYYWDIKGSQAHATMLGEVGVITQKEAQQLVEGLEALLEDIQAGKIQFYQQDEDIHMNIERLLIERIGAVGKKLHTGRSRNDQVALDLRLYLREEVTHTRQYLLELIQVLITLAKEHEDTIMPGYTHLQRAQPIVLSHHLLAYADMFQRDVTLLQDWLKNHSLMPLGSGALAGTTYPLNRHRVASLLGFEGPCTNSLDGVSDRDFVLDYEYMASRSMMHLSRFSEEIIFWSTQECQFITLDDAYSTGSSIMPQKKNPDVAELVRGKTGRVYGHLMALLTTMKGLPLAYNKDMQEDKEGLFDTVDTWQKCLLIFTKMLATMTVNKEKLYKATKDGFLNATDLADYITKKGIPFRDAHRMVGELVAYALEKQKSLEELTLQELNTIAPIIEADVYKVIAIERCVGERNTYGGPSKEQVRVAIANKEKWLESEKEH